MSVQRWICLSLLSVAKLLQNLPWKYKLSHNMVVRPSLYDKKQFVNALLRVFNGQGSWRFPWTKHAMLHCRALFVFVVFCFIRIVVWLIVGHWRIGDNIFHEYSGGEYIFEVQLLFGAMDCFVFFLCVFFFAFGWFVLLDL